MNPPNSFRDPAGYVTFESDSVVRTILPPGRANLDAYFNSAAAKRFIDNGSLVSTGIIDEDHVEHSRVPFPSYPYEWPAEMLHAAGKLTLDLCWALLHEGRGLKDATPANVLFRGPRPVFVDVLSFEQREPLDPLWLADAQFARNFPIPLLLQRRTGCPTREFFLHRRDGITPPEAARRLPRFRRWLPPDLGLVTLPAKTVGLASASTYRSRRCGEPEEARYILGRRFRSLRKKLDASMPAAGDSEWIRYERDCPSYTVEQQSAKREFVSRALAEIRPRRVLDVGSNNGEYSLMASAAGASVVAMESDPDTAGALWRSASEKNADILPLAMDFARPSPAAGWRYREHASFFDRARGYFDCALLLAVTHHLLVTDRIPLGEILELTADLTTEWAVVEYVGPEDPMFRRIARGRDALHAGYSRQVFENCAAAYFELQSAKEIPSSDRAIYLLRRKR